MAEQVMEGLRLACSQNPDEVKIAEAKLKEWQTMPGFYEALSQIFANPNVDETYRLMSLIWMKIGIDRYWRPSLPNAIKAEEKDKMKWALLHGYGSCSKKNSRQVAEMIARIVRIEPLESWQPLVPTFLAGLQCEDSSIQERALLMLLHVTKGLISKALVSHRKQFEQFTNEIYQIMLTMWMSTMQEFMKAVQDCRPMEDILHLLDKAVLALKLVKKLSLFGIPRPKENPLCNQLFKNFFPRIRELLDGRRYIMQRAEFQELKEPLEKYIVRHMKLVYEFQEKYITDFVEHAPEVIQFAYDHLFGDRMEQIVSKNVVNFPAFVIYCFNMIKTQLGYDDKMPKYNRELDMKYVKITDGFFTSDRVKVAIKRLIQIYLPMTEVEINNWADDPEEFVNDECGDSWKYTLRGSAEAFFMMICKCYEPEMSTCMTELIGNAQNLEVNLETIFFKETVYNATGLAAFRLFDQVDFDDWFQTYLCKELMAKGESLKFLRRRIIWLIGRWTGVKFSKLLRPQVYSVCTELMNPQEDVVVRISAAQTLKNVMEDFEFAPEQFLPHLGPIFQQLYVMLKDVCEVETKMNILKIMSFVIEKVSFSIKGHENELVAYLPIIWQEGAENSMLKTVILSTMREIIQALNCIPETLLPFVYSVIQMSTNIDDPSHVYLIDEGLEVWLKVIHYTKESNPELLQLATRLLPVIESSSTYLQTCLHIMQAYVLLMPEFFINIFGPGIIAGFRVMQTDMRTEGIVIVYSLYTLMLKAHPEVAIPILRPAFIDAFKTIYKEESFISVTRSCLNFLCRLLVINRGAFIEILSSIEEPDAFGCIFTAMLDKTTSTQKEEMKLVSLALLSIITEQNQTIYMNLSGILDKINRAMAQIVQEDVYDSKVLSDCLVIDGTAYDGTLTFDEMLDVEALDTATPHYERLQALGLVDPVHTIHLHHLLQNQINQIRSTLGEDNYRQLMSAQDVDILQKINTYIDLGIPELRVAEEIDNDLDTTLEAINMD